MCDTSEPTVHVSIHADRRKVENTPPQQSTLLPQADPQVDIQGGPHDDLVVVVLPMGVKVRKDTGGVDAGSKLPKFPCSAPKSVKMLINFGRCAPNSKTVHFDSVDGVVSPAPVLSYEVINGDPGQDTGFTLCSIASES